MQKSFIIKVYFAYIFHWGLDKVRYYAVVILMQNNRILACGIDAVVEQYLFQEELLAKFDLSERKTLWPKNFPEVSNSGLQ